MKSGKVSEAVLKRSVLKYITGKRKDVLSGAGIARDCGVFETISGDKIAVTGNPAFLDCEDSVYLSFHSAMNNLAVSGGKAVGLNISLMLPVLFEETDIKKIMREYDKLCKEFGVQIIGGHTELSEGMNKPLAILTFVGIINETNIPDIKKAKPGHEIVMTKDAGIEGTYVQYLKNREILKQRFSSSFLMKYEKMKEEISVVKEAGIALEHGAIAMHDIRVGGIFKGLWELGSGSGLGVEINFKDIQVRQETVELTEILEINPYKILSGGTLLIITEDGQGLVNKLNENGINAALIGKMTGTNDRVLITEEGKRYLESN